MICGSIHSPQQIPQPEPELEVVEELALQQNQAEFEEEEKEEKESLDSMHSISGQEMFETRRESPRPTTQIPSNSLPGNHSQQEFHIGASDEGSASSENTRHEEKWTEKLEEYTEMLRAEALEAQSKHIAAAAKFKLQDRLYSFPLIVLPAVVALVNLIWGKFEDNTDTIIIAITAGLNLLLTVLGGMYKAVQPNSKKQEHFWYEALYANLATEIFLTLHRGKNFRPPADAFVKEITTSIEHMRLTAPDTERGYILCKYFF